MATYLYTIELESNSTLFKDTPLYDNKDIVEHTIEIEYELYPYKMSFSNYLVPDDEAEIDILNVSVNNTPLNEDDDVERILMGAIESKYGRFLYDNAYQQYSSSIDINFDDEA
jgi:hypothetical protein